VGRAVPPEFDADTVRAYLVARAEKVRAEGLDPDALLAAIRETPEAARILPRFAELIRSA
jgi:GMP synthase (glutamine-hydrolysing)